ncbi:MAG TPA: GTP 3',8-cyclase MoaA [Nannocystaceae bacterium]|nr:GTP 3',8-cyclase MoaA [Nannocystaceae bacterium]
MSLVQLRASRERTSGPGSDAPLFDRIQRKVEYLRVSLTDRCNFRCTYCMPDRELDYGPRHELLALEEVVQVVAAFARRGVRRVRLTGGEPTLRRGIVELVGELARIESDGGPLEIVMTTNGHDLATLARPLFDAGLHGVTISIDSLRADRFARITRRGQLARVVEGVEAARAVGFASIKINTVAVRGFNDDELAELATWAWARDVVPRFIELMPMAGGELFVPGELMPAAEIRERIAQALGVAIVDRVTDRRAVGPARYVAVAGGPHDGRVLGTIGAMTENFCSGCNRLRISATGQLHGCLAHDDSGDLRGALRSRGPAGLGEIVDGVLGTKRDGHGFHLDGSGGPQKAMISIGG